MSIGTATDQMHRELPAQICKLIAKATALPLEKISAAAKLDSNLGIDSMMMIEICVAIEEEFGVLMPDLDAPELAHIRTVGDLITLVAHKLDLHDFPPSTKAGGKVKS